MTTEYIDSLHQYFVDGIEYGSVTLILQAAGLYDETFFTDGGRHRGEYVHKAILYDLQSDLDDDTVMPEWVGYIQAFRHFMGQSNCTPYLEQCEKPLFSKTFRFAGTPDIPCMLNNADSLIDVKTGAETPATGVQLAGYEILLGRSVKRYGLYLKADGKYRLIPYTDRNDIKIFNAALSLYHWRNERGLL